MRSCWLAFMLVAGFLFSPTVAGAHDDVLPSDIFTAIMLKALNYDRNIDRQAHEKVVIGIVYVDDDPTGHALAEEISANISLVKTTFKIKEKPVAGKVLGLGRIFGRQGFERWLTRNNISVLVVAVKDPAFSPDIFNVSAAMGINSVCYSAACIKQGAGLGIILKDNKPRMLINARSAKHEGSDYSGKFLALCEVLP